VREQKAGPDEGRRGGGKIELSEKGKKKLRGKGRVFAWLPHWLGQVLL